MVCLVKILIQTSNILLQSETGVNVTVPVRAIASGRAAMAAGKPDNRPLTRRFRLSTRTHRRAHTCTAGSDEAQVSAPTHPILVESLAFGSFLTLKMEFSRRKSSGRKSAGARTHTHIFLCVIVCVCARPSFVLVTEYGEFSTTCQIGTLVGSPSPGFRFLSLSISLSLSLSLSCFLYNIPRCDVAWKHTWKRTLFVVSTCHNVTQSLCLSRGPGFAEYAPERNGMGVTLLLRSDFAMIGRCFSGGMGSRITCPASGHRNNRHGVLFFLPND